MCWSVSSATVADVVDVADVADVVEVVVVAAAAAEAVVVLFYGGGITLESDVQKNEMTKEEQTPRSQLHTHTHTHVHTFTHLLTHTHTLTQTHTRFLLSGLVAQCHPPTSVLDYHTLTNLLWAKEVLRPTLLAQKNSALPSNFSPLSVF